MTLQSLENRSRYHKFVAKLYTTFRARKGVIFIDIKLAMH